MKTILFTSFLLLFNISIAQVWPTNGWEVAMPSSMGMDESKLLSARDYAIFNGGGSGFITRSGKLVMSWGEPDHLYDVASCTKTVGTILLGLAVKDGLLDMDDFAQSYHPSLGVPPQENLNKGWLELIGIKHLAAHTAGFTPEGSYTELAFEAGTEWLYCNDGANWLAEALALTFGEDLNTVMFNRVFNHMGVSPQDVDWDNYSTRPDSINGIRNLMLGYGIFTSVDVMARIGYLFLRNGQWEGQEIIPDSLVTMARSPQQEFAGLPSRDDRFPNGADQYGLLMWTNANAEMPNIPADTYLAWGHSEGFIIVIPSLDIVVSRAGGPWRDKPHKQSFYPFLEPFLQDIVDSVVDDPLAVEMSLFSGDVVQGQVRLKWRTESETNNLGFILLRKGSLQPQYRQIASYEYVNELKGQGNTNSATDYQYIDREVRPGETYSYLLQDVDYSGLRTSHGPIEVTVPVHQTPGQFVLYQNFPNPFNASTTLSFYNPEEQQISLRIFNMLGQEVLTIANEFYPPGYHQIKLDTRTLSSGMYFYRVQAQDFSDTQKMTLAK